MLILSPVEEMSDLIGRHVIERIRKEISFGLRGYALAIIGLLVLTVPIYFLFQTPPPRNAVAGAILSAALLLVILSSAWKRLALL